MQQTTTPQNAPLSANTLKELQQDKTAITYMKAVFLAMANTLTVKEFLEPVQNEILNLYKFQPKNMDDVKGCTTWYSNGQLTYKGLFLASDEDFNLYLKEYKSRFTQLGFKVKSEGNCPILEAESLERIATHHAVEYIAPKMNIDSDKLFYSLSNYKQFLELIKGLFAPMMDSKEILKLVK